MKHIAISLISIFAATAIGAGMNDTSSATTIALDYDSASTAGIVGNKELVELSGIVAGGVNNDILWVHNDRNNLPRLYALNKRGETVATYSLDTFNKSGNMSGDWEDIARTPGSKNGSFDLYIGDIGDNPLNRTEYRILIVQEPLVERNKSALIIKTDFKTIRFHFPDGYFCNNECLIVDPCSKKIFIVSKFVKKDGKKLEGGMLWSLPEITSFEKIYTAKLLMDSIPAIKKQRVTGGDISADGKYLILRTSHETAYLWEIRKTQPMEKILSSTPNRISLAKEAGGEAICFALDLSKLFTVYDGKKADRPLHVYPRK